MVLSGRGELDQTTVKLVALASGTNFSCLKESSLQRLFSLIMVSLGQSTTRVSYGSGAMSLCPSQKQCLSLIHCFLPPILATHAISSGSLSKDSE